MKHMAFAWVAAFIVRFALAEGQSIAPPWKVNPPIVTVKKGVYSKHPKPKAAAMVSVCYVGPKLERMEIHALELRDDVPDEPKFRLSSDNGRTWSPFTPLPPTLSYPKKVEVWEGSGSKFFDPAAGVLLDIWLRQIAHGGTYHNFTYSRTSRDLGRTWSTPRQLRYEDGDPFDPNEPLRPSFLKRNLAYFGNNIIRHSNGTLIHAVAASNIPPDAPDPNPHGIKTWDISADARSVGSRCFIGKWNPQQGDYDWIAGRPVWLPRHVSSRGLMEPEVAELSDGRVLLVWRGSNDGLDIKAAPGRKWYSVSTDGGMTLNEVKAWKYDDGSSFYSPSSFHRMIRHSVTRKLYWLGNITAEPPSGNSPRYPLIIAEVDETIPALRRSTVTAIDDRQPGQSGAFQLSNFSLLEDRETHELELYLTAYGEDPSHIYNADCYKYTLTLRDGRK
jgi:hypothetical protein